MPGVVVAGAAPHRSRKHSNRAYLFHLSLLAKRAGGSVTDAENMGKAIPLLQLAQASDVAATLQQMAARFAAGAGELARLVRQHQDNLARLKQAEAKIEAISRKRPRNAIRPAATRLGKY